MQAAELTAEFGIAGVLDFVETEHGLVKAAISLDGISGELYLQGAHLTAWQPSGERPVLFTSPNSAFAPGRAIRGGIPIIFPWFGANRHAPAAPQHGFARTTTWHLDGVETSGRESLTLTLGLGDGDVGSPFWPELFRATYTVTFAPTLSLRLAVQNRACAEERESGPGQQRLSRGDASTGAFASAAWRACSSCCVFAAAAWRACSSCCALAVAAWRACASCRNQARRQWPRRQTDVIRPVIDFDVDRCRIDAGQELRRLARRTYCKFDLGLTQSTDRPIADFNRGLVCPDAWARRRDLELDGREPAGAGPIRIELAGRR